MRVRRIPLAGLAVLGVLSWAGPVAAQAGTEMVEWLDDYDAALAEARRTGKPIFLEFRCAP